MTDIAWKDFYAQVGARMRAERERRRLNLEEVATIIGLGSGAVLQRYETGKRKPPLDIVMKLGKLLLNDYYSFIVTAPIPAEIPPLSALLAGADEDGEGDLALTIQTIMRNYGKVDEQTLLSRLLDILARALNIGVIALFHYDWFTSTLEKKYEWVAPRFRARIPADKPSVTEAYNVWREQFVTERAWVGKDQHTSRFITNYDRIFSESSRQINLESYRWHEQVLGNVLSTMYGIIGHPEKRYAIRCFNRSDAQNGFLDSVQYRLLSQCCDVITEHLDIKMQIRSLRASRALTTQLANDTSDLKSVLALVQEHLIQAGASSGVMLWTVDAHDDPQAFSEAFTYGAHFQGWRHHAAQGLTSPDLYRRIRSNNAPFVIDVFQEIDTVGAHTLEAHIVRLNTPPEGKSNIGRLLVLPCNRTPHTGALIIPVETGDGSRHFPTIDLLQAIPDTIATLNTYASIAYDVIQNRLRPAPSLPA